MKQKDMKDGLEREAGPAVELTRRDAFALVGGLTAAALVGGCSTSQHGTAGEPDAGTPGPDGGPGPADGGDGGATCTVYPRQTEGPFYLDLDLLRRDVTEGRPGASLSLLMVIVGTNGCVPQRDVAVDIWHCDVGGLYSGYAGQLGGVDTTGEKFMRGTQVTGDDGRVQFDTVYPGWYPGRTTHIHFKVHVAATREATSQLYFPEEVTAAVYRTAPYDARGQKDTSNAADGVNRAGGVPPLVAVSAREGGGYVATLTVSVAG
jgi:protocatechuate 3,4-dioxygenase beta subunit